MNSNAMKDAKARLNDAIARWLTGDKSASAEVEEAMRETKELRRQQTGEPCSTE